MVGLVKQGSKGPDVKLLQELLNKNGASLPTTGNFGDQTKKAVEAFQRKKNLIPVDGIVGRDTWGALGVKDYSSKKSHSPHHEEKDLPTKSDWVQLPSNGTGYYHCGGPTKDERKFQWGTPKLIQLLKDVARKWNSKYPDLMLGYNDLSKKDGSIINSLVYHNGEQIEGTEKAHSSHTNGRNADIRLIRKDKQRLGVAYTEKAYDQEKTFELIQMFLDTQQITTIYFNDPKAIKKFQKVSYCKGHHHRLHLIVNK